MLSRETEFLKLDDIKNIAVTIIDIRNNKLLAYHGNGPSQSGNFSYVDVAQAPEVMAAY
ncbi:MAG: hypothetical protein IPO37_03515 [Saprospiraceae bacterium]|nr:hypothetical protein [Saprospiraceae bacterium]